LEGQKQMTQSTVPSANGADQSTPASDISVNGYSITVGEKVIDLKTPPDNDTDKAFLNGLDTKQLKDLFEVLLDVLHGPGTPIFLPWGFWVAEIVARITDDGVEEAEYARRAAETVTGDRLRLYTPAMVQALVRSLRPVIHATELHPFHRAVLAAKAKPSEMPSPIMPSLFPKVHPDEVVNQELNKALIDADAKPDEAPADANAQKQQPLSDNDGPDKPPSSPHVSVTNHTITVKGTVLDLKTMPWDDDTIQAYVNTFKPGHCRLLLRYLLDIPHGPESEIYWTWGFWAAECVVRITNAAEKGDKTEAEYVSLIAKASPNDPKGFYTTEAIQKQLNENRETLAERRNVRLKPRPKPRGKGAGKDKKLPSDWAARSLAEQKLVLENYANSFNEPLDFVVFAFEDSLWHTPDGTPYITIGPRNIRVGSREWKNWLREIWFKVKSGETIDSYQLTACTETITALASSPEAPERDLHNRIARNAQGNTICVDLGDAENRVVQITPNGWTVSDDPPVRFARSAYADALPVPKPGGTVDDLRHFVNLDDDYYHAFVGSILDALKGHGGYLVNVVSGEHSTAKSTLTQIAAQLVDPRIAQKPGQPDELPGVPKSLDDLCISATKSHDLALDNLSALAEETSNTLCRIALGGARETRELWTTGDMNRTTFCCAVWLTGIGDLIKRGDLASRSVFYVAPPIAKFKSTTVFWKEFYAARPKILGALYDVVAKALRSEAEGPVPDDVEKPRMGASAEWIYRSFAHLSTTA
jgi:hypothetical protein